MYSCDIVVSGASPASRASERVALVIEQEIHDAAADRRVEEALEELTGLACQFYITSEQFARMVQLYPRRYPDARISAVCKLFSRVVSPS